MRFKGLAFGRSALRAPPTASRSPFPALRGGRIGEQMRGEIELIHGAENGVRLQSSSSKERARDRRHLRDGAVVETGQPLGGYQRGPGRICRDVPPSLGEPE